MDALTLEELSGKAEAGHDLDEAEIRTAADLLASSTPSSEDKGRLLVALADKGEAPAEIAAFATRFRELARDPGLDDLAADAIDVCGTGGDKSGSFNVSTFVGFVLAAGGVRVLKHGNRSITSQCGSADLLEGVGIRLDADPALLRRSAEELNFAFLFAPVHHPAFKEIMPVRRRLAEQGRPTIFNLLGPLINPAKPAFQLLGVFSPTLVEPLAKTLHALGLRNGLVVHCRLDEGRGMDELTCTGTNMATGFGELAELRETAWPLDAFGLSRGPEEDLAGGDLATNLDLLDALLEGRAPQGLRDTVSLNAGAALWIAGKVPDLQAGATMAEELFSGGRVRDWLSRTKSFYADQGA